MKTRFLLIQSKQLSPIVLLILQSLNILCQLSPNLIIWLVPHLLSQLLELILGILPHGHPVLLLVPHFLGGQVLLTGQEGPLPLAEDVSLANLGEHLEVHLLGIHETFHLVVVHTGLFILLVTLEGEVTSVTVQIPLVGGFVVTAATEGAGLGIDVNPTLGKGLDCLTRSKGNLLAALWGGILRGREWCRFGMNLLNRGERGW